MKKLLSLLLLCFTACNPSTQWTKKRIVKVVGEQGMCSGEQVRAPSGTDYILTAAHCLTLPHTGDSFSIKTEDGNTIKRRIIAEDPNSDLLLLEGLPNLEGIKIGAGVFPTEPVHAITHGGNLALYSMEGEAVETNELSIPYKPIQSDTEEAACGAMPKQHVEEIPFLGKTCVMKVRELITTVLCRPGSSGGPLFNESEELVGVASAMDAFTFGHFVMVSDIRAFLAGY